MVIRSVMTLLMLLATSNAAFASANCPKIEIKGDEYPIAREAIIKAGWEPRNLTPPFENAPFTDWVKNRNYAEVEACAGTGTAPCKFVFKSGSDKNSYLLVFTRGEEIGIVTGYECTDTLDN